MFVHKDISCVGPAGGFSTLYINLARELTSMNQEVGIITSREDPWNLRAERYILDDSDLNARQKKITEAVIDWKPDIVECPSWGAELADYVTTLNPTNVFVRGDIPSRLFPYGNNVLEEETLACRARTVIAISTWSSLEWSSVTGKKTPVVPHGVDPSYVDLVDKEKELIVWIGRASWMKGIDLLASIAPKITKKYKLVCVVAPTRYEDRQSLNNLRSAGADILAGLNEEEYKKLLAKATFILSTARKEGFCIAVLEGMAHGALPVVPSWVGGTLDFVTPDVGLIFDDIDDVPYLLNSIDPSPIKLQKIQEKTLSYSWYHTAQKTMRIYQKYTKY